MKICSKCKNSKPTNLFYKQKLSKDGRQRWCKDCCSTNGRNYWSKNAAYFRQHRYGLLPHEYDSMFVAQAGCCAVCEIRLTTPHIDHDHTTGEVRGLLCRSCNIGIGMFCDSPERMRRAMEYVN